MEIAPNQREAETWNKTVREALEALKPLAHDNDRKQLLKSVRHILTESKCGCDSIEREGHVLVSCVSILLTLGKEPKQLRRFVSKLATYLGIQPTMTLDLAQEVERLQLANKNLEEALKTYAIETHTARLFLPYVSARKGEIKDHRAHTALRICQLHAALVVGLGFGYGSEKQGVVAAVYEKDPSSKSPKLTKCFTEFDEFIEFIEGARNDTLFTIEEFEDGCGNFYIAGGTQIFSHDLFDEMAIPAMFSDFGYETTFTWDPAIGYNRMHFRKIDSEETE